MNLRKMFPLIIMLCLALPVIAQDSNRGTAEATIKGKKVSINYGRPSLKGRDMLGQATPGTVWRLGMNGATEIDTAADLVIAGKELKAGKYSLWAKKTDGKTWVLAFHPKTGVWGAPVLKEGYVAELPLKTGTATDSAEQLTISLADNKGKGMVTIQWGTATLSGSFDVK